MFIAQVVTPQICDRPVVCRPLKQRARAISETVSMAEPAAHPSARPVPPAARAVGRGRGHSVRPAGFKPTLQDWEAYRELVARLVIEDPVYIPIFKRIEAEIARAVEQEDVISRARKIADGGIR